LPWTSGKIASLRGPGGGGVEGRPIVTPLLPLPPRCSDVFTEKAKGRRGVKEPRRLPSDEGSVGRDEKDPYHGLTSSLTRKGDIQIACALERSRSKISIFASR